MKVKVEFDKAGVQARLNNLTSRAQLVLDNQILKDSNYYCKEDTGDLIRSGHIPAAGTIEWDESYARKQYYLPDASTDKNPNARYKWFEAAKATKLAQWIKLVEGIIKGGKND